MRSLVLFFLLFSTQAFSDSMKDLKSSKPFKDLRFNEENCFVLKSVIDMSQCLDNALLDYSNKTSDICDKFKKSHLNYYDCLKDKETLEIDRKNAYAFNLEKVKQKDKMVSGEKYLNVCNKINTDTKKEPEFCKQLMKKAILGATEVEFCNKTSSGDKFLNRQCFMAIANRTYMFSDINKCQNPLGGIPSVACLESNKFEEIKNKQFCRSDCECVIGSYMKCSEGTYTFIGDKLSNKINQSPRNNVQIKEPKDTISRPDANNAVPK